LNGNNKARAVEFRRRHQSGQEYYHPFYRYWGQFLCAQA
jgi:hypothetical protein